jgi:hypothetical protein
MSLKSAVELLQIASDAIKIDQSGLFGKGKHALTIEKDQLVLTINTGHEFKNFLLDEEDLQREPQVLMVEIEKFLRTDKLKELN